MYPAAIPTETGSRSTVPTLPDSESSPPIPEASPPRWTVESVVTFPQG